MKKHLFILLFALLFTQLEAQTFFGPENPISSPAVAQPEFFDATDLDSDGDLDALIVSRGTESIAWLENLNGQGFFGEAHFLADGLNQPSNSIGVDVDGDGDNDVVSAVWGENELFWLENLDGQGSFGPKQMIDDYISGIWRVHDADVDKDGDLDLVVAAREAGHISWYENLDGAGNFSEEIIIDSEMQNPRDAFPVDLDNDGDLDIVTADWSLNILCWHENTDGLGTFSDRIQISDAIDDIDIVYCVDFDLDGLMDILVRDRTEVFWLKNLDGGNTFSAGKNISQGKPVHEYLPSDFDGDGDPDIIVVNGSQGNIGWFKNDGQGQFGPLMIIPNDVGGCSFIHSADLDGDNDQDIIGMAWYQGLVYWHENEDGAGNTQIGRIISQPDVAGPVDMALEDLDGDGQNEIVVASKFSNKLYLYEKAARYGDYGSAMELPGYVLTPSSIDIADVDGDGKKDILCSSLNDGALYWSKNLGGNQFRMPYLVGELQNSATDVVAADMDGDGDNDVIGTSLYGNMLGIYVNDGAGNFGNFVMVSDLLGGAFEILAMDLDGDGDIDLAVVSKYDDKLSWFENMGNLTFSSEKVIISDVNGIDNLVGADMDGDLDKDIVVTAYDYLAWAENVNGRAEFVVHEIDPGDYMRTITALEVADVDADGDLDIFTGSEDHDYVNWFMNEDNGTSFTRQLTIGEKLNEPADIAFEDVDNDGKLDVVLSSLFDNRIGWYRNEAYPVFGEQPQEVTICQSGEVKFSASADKADAYRWQVSNPYNDWFGELQENEVYSGVHSQELTVEVSGTNFDQARYRCVVTYLGKEFYSNPALLTVDRFIEANAGSDYVTCNSYINLYANDPNQGAGEWTISNGYGNFSDNNDAYAQVTDLQSGSNLFLWTITNGTCVSEDEVEVVKYDSVWVSIPVDTVVVNDDENAVLAVEATGDIKSYQWYSENGILTEEPGYVEGTQTATLTLYHVMDDVHPGNYHCIIEGECNWAYSDNIYLDVLSTNTENLSDEDIRLYPNPVDELLHVESTLNISSYSIISEEGKQIRHIGNIDKKLFSIPVDRLPNGFYVLKIEMEQGSKVLRFVK